MRGWKRGGRGGSGDSRLDVHGAGVGALVGRVCADELVYAAALLDELVGREVGLLGPVEVAGRGREELEDVDAVGGGLVKGGVAGEDDEVVDDGAGRRQRGKG